MARGKKNSVEIVAVEKMHETIELVERLYSDGMPYEIDRIENEVRFYQDQAGQSLLEMGKRFIRIKAHEEHGRFMRALENVGISQRGANYAMAAARKFSNSQTFANLGQSKQIVLTVLDEKDIETLEDGGDIAGMTLDDIDRMTTRELRENLRKEKEKVNKEKEARKNDREVQEKAIAQKEAKINELDQQLRYQQPPTKEQIAVAELAKLNDGYIDALVSAMGAMRRAVTVLGWAQCTPGVNAQILNEWVDNYNDQMQLLNGVHAELTDTIDNLHPIDKGAYKED